jgi:hypothetical protein
LHKKAELTVDGGYHRQGHFRYQHGWNQEENPPVSERLANILQFRRWVWVLEDSNMSTVITDYTLWMDDKQQRNKDGCNLNSDEDRVDWRGHTDSFCLFMRGAKGYQGTNKAARRFHHELNTDELKSGC